MKPVVTRVLAIMIAAAAVLDPSLTSPRSTRPIVAVVPGRQDDAQLARRISDVLDRRFTPVAAESDAASATVLVGSNMPDEFRAGPGTLFVVSPQPNRPDVRITRIDAPRVAHLYSRVGVDVHVATMGTARQQIDAQVRMRGVVVAESSTTLDSGANVITLSLPVVPQPGVQVLQALVRLRGASRSDSAQFVMEAREDRFPVLFHDARPSWNSTFVRRALARDARFVVTHRVATSRGLSNVAGAAPRSLRDWDALRGFSTIIVGAPEQLSRAEVSGLEAFMRRRGGQVILLYDRRSAASIDQLTGVQSWRTTESATPLHVSDVSGTRILRGRSLYWPASLPTGADIEAFITGRDSSRRPVVWSMPVGAGRLLISGVTDAWHFRGDSSGFDTFWTLKIAEHAQAAPPAVDVRIARSILEAGEETTVRLTIRDALLAELDARASVRGYMVSAADSTPVRFWPTGTPGVLEAKIVAPRTLDTVNVVAVAGADQGVASLVVDSAARNPGGDERAALTAIASSHGGAMVRDDELDQLPRLIASAVQPVSRVETWHPMRSGWWIVPFALLLGTEWWWRRRRGLA